MKAMFLTNEYPPNIYGGAGVHVEYLTKELSNLLKIDVRSFGNQIYDSSTLKVKGYNVKNKIIDKAPQKIKPALYALYNNILFNSDNVDADIVHCHTWYSHFGGILAKILYDIPLVITTHSLEPLRPWKKEQLGRGYELSSWVEKTALGMSDAIIAVSEETKKDLLNNFDNVKNKNIIVIPNGVDVEEYKYIEGTEILDKYSIPKDLNFVLFVGRITRQKGIIHLLNAIQYIDPSIGVVLCAGAPDTDDIAKEMKIGFDKIHNKRKNVFWIEEILPKNELIQLYSRAKLFCCPSIYEPFGIINLEAMACETPVVGSAVGGIKEIVINNETGILISFEQKKESPFDAIYPNKFSQDIANVINELMKNETLRNNMAKKGRKRVEEVYSWKAIAKEIAGLYKNILEKKE